MTEEVEEALSFKEAKLKMEKELDKIQQDMYKSVPFFSTRYKVRLVDLRIVYSLLFDVL